MKKHPDLAVKDSALNRLFVRRYIELQASSSNYLLSPDWPVRLAEECAAALQQQETAPQGTQSPGARERKVGDDQRLARTTRPEATERPDALRREQAAISPKEAALTLSDATSVFGNVVIIVVLLCIVAALCWMIAHWKFLKDIYDVGQLLWKLFFG